MLSPQLKTAWENVTFCLQNNGSVDLRSLRSHQNTILQEGTKTELIHTFHEKNLLNPIPEIHWTVDRGNEEYKRRFGFDIIHFLQHFSRLGHEQILLELGQGSGHFLEEVSSLGEYTSFGLCDRLYYPLNSFIQSTLSFERIENEVGELREQERKILSDFLYKILVVNTDFLQEIQQDEKKDHLKYDNNVIRNIRTSPYEVLSQLMKKLDFIKTLTKFPDTISTRDNIGNVLYPYRLLKPESDTFHRACDFIASSPNSAFISQNDTNAFEHISTYPFGTIIGNFSQISHLVNQKIDFAIGTRSSVYLRNQDYIKFMEEASQKITDEGFYIDDNIRDNDGWYYRLAELFQVQKNIQIPLHVILGDAFKGEDHFQEGKVPLGVIMTNSNEKLTYIHKNIGNNFSLRELDEILDNTEYLRSLDKTGLVEKSVREAISN